jgi:hypothetical protein
MLLQRPGETITREELQKKLWPADTFVDFQQGLNSAMKRLLENGPDIRTFDVHTSIGIRSSRTGIEGPCSRKFGGRVRSLVSNNKRPTVAVKFSWWRGTRSKLV